MNAMHIHQVAYDEAAAWLATRPICPVCKTPLVGFIAHTKTKCQECETVSTVKWTDNGELVVVDHEANLSPHS